MERKVDLLRKVNWYHKILVLMSLASILILFLFQLSHINVFAATWDQVDYSLALERFDIMAMQPHFPGYPYFILGGLFIHRFHRGSNGFLNII